MRLLPGRGADAVLLCTLLFPAISSALGNIDCHRIVADKQTFDLSKLGGPHSVMESVETLPTFKNTTYTIDICQALKRPSSISETKKCPGGTRICAIVRAINPEEKTDMITNVIPIAGDLQDFKGGPLDAHITRLRTSPSNEDAKREGVRIELNGGIYEGRKQRAVVEFICDKDRTGDEGNFDPEDKYQSEKRQLMNREDGEGNNATDISPSLQVKSFGVDPANDKIDLLRMEWLTKYACEDQRDIDKGESSQSWGFFTWFLLIAFLSTAAYLIFGSWLNYNRYGARGWDLLPHGDTIRDVPYLFKDWTRRVFNTVQGGGSRGGYSAV